MTIAFTCVLIVVIMPLVWANIAKSDLFKAKAYDNNSPRALMENLEGKCQRANWAQQNSFEALPGFIAAVIIASIAGASQTAVDILAVIFVICRIAFGILYIKDIATARSISWVIGFFSMIGIFVCAYMA